MKRRDFLKAAAACAPLTGCTPSARKPDLPPGVLLGASSDIGHRLRDGGFPAPDRVEQVPVLIIGAGVGGLSAAWKFDRSGFRDFRILELENEAGGNARYGRNAVSAFPWGAHYLPLPTREARAVRELLAEFGILQGDPHAPRPSYDERFLCHSPQERIHAHGVWQDGLIPLLGLAPAERQQIDRFHAHMAVLRAARDATGRRAFAIPVAYSSSAPEWRSLDAITMTQWMRRQGFDAPTLLWYVNYCCNDDYGTRADHTSAWAGIHYFASRNAEAANAGADAVLTAPEGNGWLIRRLRERVQERIQPGALAFRLQQDSEGIEVDAWLPVTRQALRIRARHVVWAGPLFPLPHIATHLPAHFRALMQEGDYAPWLVANLTLRDTPLQTPGAPLSWDNVLYGAPGLGYVLATHQNLALRPGPTVLTYYRAFADEPATTARKRLLTESRDYWAEAILSELERAHPDLRELTTQLDVFRHGHAMIRPLPGVVWDARRQALAKGWGRLQFAHADLSGMSVFEEANHHGVAAAEAILGRLGVTFTSSLA